MADKLGIYNKDLEVLDRIASGKNIYGFICAHGREVQRAAERGAAAIRFQDRLNEKLKCWEKME